ncbi:tyrosine-type recombinase/integrase [Kushneria sp. AK178]
MPTLKFTQNRVDKLKVESGKRKTVYADSTTKGLLLETRSSGSATWYLRYRDADKKLRQYRIGDRNVITLGQARHIAHQLHFRISSGEDPMIMRREQFECPTVEAFFRGDYLDSVRQRNRGWRTDEAFIRLYVVPIIGHLKVNRVGLQEVQEVMRHREPQASAATLNRGISSLRSLFNCAVKWQVGGITENPARGLKKYKEAQRPVKYLSPDQARRLIAAAEHSANPWLKYILVLLLQTGARKGELLKARWKDIDLDRGHWYVPQSKSGKPLCKLLNARAVSTLRALPSRHSSEWLFPNEHNHGQPLGMFYHSWDTARREAGLEGFRIHDLRHTFASTLVRSGHSLYEVKELLGHTNITTTQRYAHLDPEHLRQTLNTMDRLFDIRVS